MSLLWCYTKWGEEEEWKTLPSRKWPINKYQINKRMRKHHFFETIVIVGFGKCHWWMSKPFDEVLLATRFIQFKIITLSLFINSNN